MGEKISAGVEQYFSDWEDIEEFGKTRQEWFKTFLELPNGDSIARSLQSRVGAIRPGPVSRLFYQLDNSRKSARGRAGHCN